MGHPVSGGLLYAGKAGGHRTGAAPSTSTLWSRIAGNHLRGNTGSSTLRKSLAAVLGTRTRDFSEDDLSAWMHTHLRVLAVPVPSEQVAELEDVLVTRAMPPLNLMGLPRDPARSALSRLRGLLSRSVAPEAPPPEAGSELSSAAEGETAARADAATAFERRLRADVAAIVAAGYRPTTYQRMLAEHGAVGAARRLLASPQLSDGFRYLWEHGLLRLSVEAAVLDDHFADLFRAEERDTARQRLRDAGHL